MKYTKCRICSPESRLLWMMFLTTGFMLVELIVGHITSSMALVADSFHMMSDVLSIIVAYISVRISPKEWKRNTYGYARAEVVGALVNAVFLLALCFSIFVDAIKRFFDPEEITEPKLVLIIGVVGLVVNVIGMLLFGSEAHGHSHEDNNNEEDSHSGDHNHSHGDGASSGAQMNIKGVFLHVMADALGSVVVIISALVIWQTDWEYRFYLDPVLSLLLVLIITVTTLPLLRDSTLVLLNAIPRHIDLQQLESRLLDTVDGLASVHELHVWRLVGKRVVASCHLKVHPPPPGVAPWVHHMRIQQEIKEIFHQGGIHSTSIQLEYLLPSIPLEETPSDCEVECPKRTDNSQEQDCEQKLCCRKPSQVESWGEENPAARDEMSVSRYV